MRLSPLAMPLVFAAVAALFLALCVAETTQPARAAEAKPATPEAQCTCPQSRQELWPRRKFAQSPGEAPAFVAGDPRLADETIALDQIAFGLNEAGDGGSYVWQRNDGRLAGIVTPTGSFKDAGGHVCRHVVVTLSRADISRRVEGVACRQEDGRWQLEG
jgi:hypothetical protein